MIEQLLDTTMAGPPPHIMRGPADGPYIDDEVVLKCLEEDQYFDYSEVVSGIATLQIGRKWANFELSGLSSEDLLDIEIAVSLSCKNGLVGIWLPTSDYHIRNESIPNKSLEYRELESGSRIYVDCNSWTFGETAKIKLRPLQENNSIQPIKFTVLARPIQEAAENFQMNFSITQNEKSILRKEFEFIVGGADNKESEQKMMEIYQRFRGYGAILPSGDGNIVHPKQYITIRGMDLIIDEFLVDKNRISELKIAYIGTDTTENLRSLLRWLHKNGHMSKVVEFCLFYYDEWDYDFMESIDLINEIKETYSDFNIVRRDLSTSTISGLKNKESFDIIVSTYVTPWAEGTPGEENYVNFLQNAMGPASFLLSVDPQTQHNSVRSELINTKINNDGLYKKKVGLQEAKSLQIKDNSSVGWSVWEKKKEGDILG